MNQNGLPVNWMYSTIGEVAQVKTGKTPSRTDPKNFGGKIPWVKTAEVSDCVIQDTEEHLTEQGMEESNNDLFPAGSILVALYGQGQTRGRTAMLGIPATTNQACAVLLPSSKADQDYLWWWLRASYVPLRDLGRGGNQPNLNLDIVRNFGIPLPPLPEQRRIAAILDKADAIRRKREEGIRLTEELLRSTFLEMFGDPATNPKGWDIVPLGQAISVKSGDFLPAKAMNSEGQCAVYGGNGINGRHNEYLFDTPQIVIGRVGIYCGVIHYTEPCSWVTDNALYVSERKVELQDQYLVAALTHANLNQYASRFGQPLISGQRIAQVPIAVPPVPNQRKFGDAVNKVHELTSRRRTALNECQDLFQSLVQRAFRGEL